MSSENKAIVVKNITKSFRIPLDKGKSVKNKILGRATRGYREFTPLNDISFTVYEGDFFGIVGRNGSGKSTLLKTIAGIYEPSAGKVEVNGTLVPFIELGVGFNPQLTGRENVYLNAALLGFSRSEIDDMYDDIVDFAELHDFMEERLQNYSSGMQVRLAFSISIRAKGDILLLDEVLAVGDSAFQQKCYDYFDQLKKENRTVILVTHSMNNVERFCNRALLLNNSKVEFIGEPQDVAQKYTELFASPVAVDVESSDVVETSEDRLDIAISSVRMYQHDRKSNNITAFEPFTIKFKMKILVNGLTNINPVILISDSENNSMLIRDVRHETGTFIEAEKGTTVEVEYDIKDNIYTNGKYTVSVVVNIDDGVGGRRRAVVSDNSQQFVIDGIDNNPSSLVHPDVDVRVGYEERSI